jgi:hypothetical protein
MTRPEPGQVIPGTPVSPEVKAEFDSLRAIFDTKAAFDRLDAYGKWLFGSTTIVGALGAGLSNSVFAKLRGPAAWVFGAAVLCLGICLVFASLSIAPEWAKVRLSELSSMLTAINNQFRRRQRFLTIASFLFALSLALAASAPLLSLIRGKIAPVVHFSLDDKGSLDAGLDGEDLPAGSLVEMRLVSEDGSKQPLPSTSTTVERSGEAKLILKMTGIDPLKSSLSLVACLRPSPQSGCVEVAHLAVTRKQ